MRFLSLWLGAVVLGAGALLLAGAPGARADAPADPTPLVADAGGPLPAQPGTDAEARDYAQREAQSPEAGEFAGGLTLFGLLVFVALVLLIVWLAKEI